MEKMMKLLSPICLLMSQKNLELRGETRPEGIALEFIFVQVIFEIPRAPQNTWGASIR